MGRPIKKQLKLLSSIQSQSMKGIPVKQKEAIIDIGDWIKTVLKKQHLVHTKTDLWQFTSEFCGASGKSLEEYYNKLKERSTKKEKKPNKYRIKKESESEVKIENTENSSSSKPF